MSYTQTVTQKRAAFALNRVKAQLSGDEALEPEHQAELRSRTNDLPALIHRNGLGQAIALYQAKGRPAHNALYDMLSEWLRQPDQPYAGQHDLMRAITESDADAYRAAQAEAQALLVWIKQFVRAFVSVSDTEEAGDD